MRHSNLKVHKKYFSKTPLQKVHYRFLTWSSEDLSLAPHRCSLKVFLFFADSLLFTFHWRLWVWAIDLPTILNIIKRSHKFYPMVLYYIHIVILNKMYLIHYYYFFFVCRVIPCLTRKRKESYTFYAFFLSLT